MVKLNLKKKFKHLYVPTIHSVSVVDVPAFNYIMVDGQGPPDCKTAVQAFQVLFPVAYTIKFSMKNLGRDYTVMPLEGLWWADDMDDFIKGQRNRWKWTYMIMQPEFVTKEIYSKALKKVGEKSMSPGLEKIHFTKFKEGKAAQILHIGPFSEEGENIQKLHTHIEKIGGLFDGHQNKHHEIYLSDLRKIAPNKMKTVLRQPFR